MTLTLYNTLTRRKEPFRPIDANNVRMYVCGPTVYDFAHIGNARPVIVFDVLFRLLRHIYGAEHVTYARNITDVEDKINARAAEEYPSLPLNEAIRKVTEKTTKQFHKDVHALHARRPTVEPRATHHIDQMIEMIETLMKKRYAYKAEGHVLFDVSRMREYGKLSNRSLKEMEAGARIEVAPYKRNPTDFVLWKPSEPFMPAWDSPWGLGRPGWHIECSAMAEKHLGRVFDIHGGGIDLVFPHHENELAQSRCAHGTRIMARVWMHNGFLQVEGEKMSKSLRNFVTINELLESSKFGGKSWSGSVLRVAMLQTHYRQPIDWTVRALQQSEARLTQWREFAAHRTARENNRELEEKFLAALSDDLNTPAALNLLDETSNRRSATDQDRFTVHKLLQLIGIKSSLTPVSKAVGAIRPAARSLSLLSFSDWLTVHHRAQLEALKSEVVPGANTQLLASVRATSDLQQRLRTTFARSLSKLDGIALELEPSSLPRRQSTRDKGDAKRTKQVERAVTKLQKVFKEISHLSLNDWTNLADSVERGPRFLSGEPKPEALLFAYIEWLSKVRDDVDGQLRLSEDRLSSVEHKILEAIGPKEDALGKKVVALLAARNAARKAKDFKESDRIRDELATMGIQLKDAKDPATGEIVTTWEVKR